MALLLYLLNNQLEMGMVNIRPTGRANNTVPNCASFKWSWFCMVGIRDAQVENPKPEIKKNMAAPIRYCCGVLT